ncbi:autoinducer binding domain-containing protein [Mesorhizobium sp. WSM3868]|uniref:autoinducer binding domain-containing protein n=1 Tax=Mesorhizobium sp. WSM3868 TaxID=2029405 RepID=UPI0032AFE0B3
MQLVFETLLEQLSLSADEVDFHNALANAAGAFDIPAFAYLSLVPDRVTKPRLISNYHPGWKSHYLGHQYQRIDPVIEWARCSECAFQWDRISAMPAFQRDSNSFSRRLPNSASAAD